MKNTYLKIALIILTTINLQVYAQLPVNVTFDEPTFTLTPNSYYKNTSVKDYTIGATKFRYSWDTAYGGYWKSGISYTNIKDTTNGTFTNLYGCAAYNAYNGNNYATAQDGAVITFSNSLNYVSGFFITNSTYAWKTIKNGNTFSRKFGDTTGTYSGGVYPQGGYPDYFKVVAYGYRGGIIKPDSAELYLADYRFTASSSDYIVKTWRYLNCSSIGIVDSIVFKLRSSDNGLFGMNTPGFFCMDNFTSINTVGIEELTTISNISLYPNPANNFIYLNFESKEASPLSINLYDISGKEVFTEKQDAQIGINNFSIDISAIDAGLYFIELKNATSTKRIKIVKQ